MLKKLLMGSLLSILISMPVYADFPASRLMYMCKHGVDALDPNDSNMPVDNEAFYFCQGYLFGAISISQDILLSTGDKKYKNTFLLMESLSGPELVKNFYSVVNTVPLTPGLSSTELFYDYLFAVNAYLLRAKSP